MIVVRDQVERNDTAAVARIAWSKYMHTKDVESSHLPGQKRGNSQDEEGHDLLACLLSSSDYVQPTRKKKFTSWEPKYYKLACLVQNELLHRREPQKLI